MKDSSATPPPEADELRRALKQQIRHPYITGQGIVAPDASAAAEQKGGSAELEDEEKKESPTAAETG
jgi:hypothetical protein